MSPMKRMVILSLVLSGLATEAVAQVRPNDDQRRREEQNRGGNRGGDQRGGDRGGDQRGGDRGGNRGGDQRNEQERRLREEQQRRQNEEQQRRQNEEQQRRQNEEQQRRQNEEQRRRDEDRRRNPGPGPGPVRPNPGPGPIRPDDRRPPIRGGHDPRDRQRVERQREEVRYQRDLRRLEIERYNQQRRNVRDDWRRQHQIRVTRDSRIYDVHRWTPRYETWWYVNARPSYVSVYVNWYRPMPVASYWSYYDVSIVADNMEYLTREIYSVMASVSYSTPNQEYGYRLRDVLARLSDAAENFNDSVDRSYDWSESLYDLFYLESLVVQAEQTLMGYSQSYRVHNQMQALRYYVNEMLWQYRQNYY